MLSLKEQQRRLSLEEEIKLAVRDISAMLFTRCGMCVLVSSDLNNFSPFWCIEKE